MNQQKSFTPNPSPKSRFLENQDAVKRHLDLIVNPHFIAASEVALLQLVRETVTGYDKNPQTALAGFHRIEGAYLYLQTLRTLGVSAPLPVISDPYNLDQRKDQ